MRIWSGVYTGKYSEKRPRESHIVVVVDRFYLALMQTQCAGMWFYMTLFIARFWISTEVVHLLFVSDTVSILSQGVGNKTITTAVLFKLVFNCNFSTLPWLCALIAEIIWLSVRLQEERLPQQALLVLQGWPAVQQPVRLWPWSVPEQAARQREWWRNLFASTSLVWGFTNADVGAFWSCHFSISFIYSPGVWVCLSVSLSGRKIAQLGLWYW